jgi:hypothetical protein
MDLEALQAWAVIIGAVALGVYGFYVAYAGWKAITGRGPNSTPDAAGDVETAGRGFRTFYTVAIVTLAAG